MNQNERIQPAALRRPVYRPRQTEESDVGLTPKEIFDMLRRHMLLIVILTICGLIAGGVSWALLRKYAPKYTARTLVEVLPPIDSDPTQFRGIQVNKDIQYNYRVSIAALMKQESMLMALLGRDKVTETNWYNKFGETSAKKSQGAFRNLEEHLGVSPSRESNFVSVSMTCGNPKEAALIVNQMVDLFVNTYGGTKIGEAREKLAVYTQRKQQIQRDLDEESNRLDAVRRNMPEGFTDLEERQYRDTSTLRFDKLQSEEDILALNISQLRGTIKSLERQATGPINEQVKNLIETDPIMVTLAQQKALQQSVLAGQLAKFGENHREVQRIQERINEIEARREMRRKEIAEQVRRSNLANAQDQLVALMQRWEELQARKKTARKQKEDMDTNRVIYERRLKRRDELQAMLEDINKNIEKQSIIVNDPETAKVKKVGDAPVPRTISSPRWELFFPGGTFLGFVLGLGLALLAEFLNDLVRTPRDISRHLNIPLLGVIPDADEDGQVRDIDLCHVVRQAPYSIISESYRRLRTNFELSDKQKSSKVILLGCGMPGEGNTTVAVNLASVLASEGKKLLLIDANFRRPSLENVFSVNDKKESIQKARKGLGDLLTGKATLEDVIMNSPVQNVDVICAGTIPSHPAELLGTRRMEELIELQREHYDYIIIDGPPVLLVSDAKILANLADGVMLVFNAGSTHRGAAQRTVRELQAVHTNILGCVLCAVKSLKGGYFREQFKIYKRYHQMQLSSPA